MAKGEGRIAGLWIGLALLAGASYAAPPAPAEKLKVTQSQIKQLQQRAAELEQNKQKLTGELSVLQEKLIALAEAAHKHEQRLMELEETQSGLNADIKAAQDDLHTHRAEIASLVASLIRLSRIPPEAVIAMPGELRHTMQAASLLQSTTRQLQQKAGGLTQKLDALQSKQESLKKTHLALAEEKQQLKTAQAGLAQEVATRKKISEKLGREHAREQSKIAILTRESKSLQQLLEKLERDRKAKAAAAARLAALPRAKPLPPAVSPVPALPPKRWEPAQETTLARLPAAGQRFASFPAARGKLMLPVAGRVSERYGQKLRQNQTSRGLSIASRSGNVVLAPYAGEVVFTGPFLDYGRMVILRYDSGYHLLLAGLDEINCTVGQHVAAGEPLGRLSNGGMKPGALYLELRYQSKPVDPSPWFG